jgi:hypothetical protein
MSEDEEPKSQVVSGPICEYCGKSSDSIFECYVKRELHGRFEMVKIYLCALHFMGQLEQDIDEPVPPPPPDYNPFGEETPENDEDDEEEKEEEDDDDQNKCNVDHQGQSFG